MNTNYTYDPQLISLHRCFTAIFITLLIALLIGGYIYTKHYEIIATEAIKAGLVQQKTNNGTIWIKPEDYKPYPLSKYDAPNWNK